MHSNDFPPLHKLTFIQTSTLHPFIFTVLHFFIFCFYFPQALSQTPEDIRPQICSNSSPFSSFRKSPLCSPQCLYVEWLLTLAQIIHTCTCVDCLPLSLTAYTGSTAASNQSVSSPSNQQYSSHSEQIFPRSVTLFFRHLFLAWNRIYPTYIIKLNTSESHT